MKADIKLNLVLDFLSYIKKWDLADWAIFVIIIYVIIWCLINGDKK